MKNTNYDNEGKQWGDSGYEQEYPIYSNHSNGSSNELGYIFLIALCILAVPVIFSGFIQWEVSQSLNIPKTSVVVGDEEYLNEVFSTGDVRQLNLTLVEKSTDKMTMVEGFYKYKSYDYFKAVMVNETGERYTVIFSDKTFYDNMRLDTPLILDMYKDSINNYSNGLSKDKKTYFYVEK